MNSAGNNSSTTSPSEDSNNGSLLKQTLMNVDECFLYKLPPLATSGGHRAEQWDLSKPMQTCGFQVERRNNDLYLLFTMENHTKLFALSKIDSQSDVHKSVEGVMDSSRYFVTQVQAQQANKSAYVGFGFRDRDIAIDLLGNLQQFQKSIQRELQAKNMKVAEIPKLAEGEKIHINIGGNNNNNSNKANSEAKKTNKSSSMSDGPVLLKKPPKVEMSADGTTNTSEPPHTPATATFSTPVQVQMDEMKIQEDHRSVASVESDMAHATTSVGGDLSAAGLGVDLDVDDDDMKDDDEWDDFQQA